MPEQYDGRQNEDLTDIVLSAHLHAGLDYRVSENMLVGAKLTYSMVGDMEAKGGYGLPSGSPASYEYQRNQRHEPFLLDVRGEILLRRVMAGGIVSGACLRSRF